jgi:hypothetical protein
MAGVYTDNVSEEELNAYAEGLSESIPKNAPESDFADPPKGLYVGDAKHAGLAVQAVSRKGFRGNVAKNKSNPGVKSKVGAAVRKFYKGELQKYYLSWLRTGKKPDKRPVTEIAIMTPRFEPADEPRFPDPPISPGVNLAELTLNDPKALFVTRPLAIEGGVSDNNLQYTGDMLTEIYQQVLTKRPPARLGHVSENNRSWEVPPDSGLWVGVLDVPNDEIFGKRTIYGKCYIYPTMPLHEMVRKRLAAGTSLSNSIWGLADLVDNPDGTVSSQSTDIESIDFVSPERAALKALGGDFVVTSEMKEEAMAEEHSDAAADLDLFKKAVASIKPENVQDVHDMLHEAGRAHEVARAHIRLHEAGGACDGQMHEMFTREGRAKMAEAHFREEATPEETYKMLPEGHRKHVAENYMKEFGNTLAEETKVKEEAKTKEAIGEMSNRLAEMEKTIKAYQRADFERALDAAIDTYFPVQLHTDKGKEGLSNLKRQMRKGTLAEMAGMDKGQVPDNIKTACDKVWEEDTKALTEMFYASVAGPGVVVAPPRGGNPKDFRTGIDQSTGFFSTEFMQTAKAVSAGARRQKGGAK